MATAPITLSEVLQLRKNGGLINDEILAVLELGSQSLSTLIESAKISSVQNMGFSMDSIYFLSEGSVLLKPLPFEILNNRFVPPECLSDDKPGNSARRDLEKMYIFSFGAVLIFALEYGNQGVVMSTPEVYSLLNLMTIRDPAVRLNLEKVTQMTERLVQANKVDTIQVVQKLFDSITENGVEEETKAKANRVIVPNVGDVASSTNVFDIDNPSYITLRSEDKYTNRGDVFAGGLEVAFNNSEDYHIDEQLFPVKVLQYSGDDIVADFESEHVPIIPDIIVEKFAEDMIEAILNPVPKYDIVDSTGNSAPNGYSESSSEDDEMACEILNHNHLLGKNQFEKFPSTNMESCELNFYNMVNEANRQNADNNHLDYSLADEGDDSDGDIAVPNNKPDVIIKVSQHEVYIPVVISTLTKDVGIFLDENVTYPKIEHLDTEENNSLDLEITSLIGKSNNNDEFFGLGSIRNNIDSQRSSWPNFEDWNKKVEKEEAQSLWFSAVPSSSKPSSVTSSVSKCGNEESLLKVVDCSSASPFDEDFDTFSYSKNEAFTADFLEGNMANGNPSTKSVEVLQKLMPMSPEDFVGLKSHGNLAYVRKHHSQRCYLCSPRKSAPNVKRKSLPNLRLEPGSLISLAVFIRSHSSTESIARSEVIKHEKSISPIDSSQVNLDLTQNSLKKRKDLFASFEKLAASSESPSPVDNDWYNIGNTKENISGKTIGSTKQSNNNTRNSYQTVGRVDKNDPSLESEPLSLSSDEDEGRLSIDSDDLRLKPIVECENEHDDLENSNRRSTENSSETYGVMRKKRQPPKTENHKSNSEPKIKEPFPANYLTKADPTVTVIADDEPGRLSRGNSMRIKGGSIRRNNSIRQHKSVNLAGPQVDKDTFDVGSNNSIDIRRNTSIKVDKPYLPARSLPLGMHEPKRVPTGPEFLFNSRQPSIRLKAPASQKPKKLFRHLLEKNVLVILLNGQRVDVSCRTDSTAENIFESVSVHTNLNERHFFGLTVLKDGEHFFLEPEQRLEKFCPPGWRSHNRHILNARILFTLYLRVKYYPVTLDFVKTEQTLHHIYLQLRRDVLDERLQCQRSAACQLAALALQAEYGDKRDTLEYFMLSHYMPDRHMLSEIGNDDMMRREISDLWLKYVGMTLREAEMEYVKLCQTLREYGIHFHRLYRSKPSSLLTPSPLGDPDTGTQLWIGIMPRGVIVFEEQDGNRVPISQHPWHTTDTLQFDHKKFIICPHSDGSIEPPKFIYYTDDYKKSMYFVNFAAGQHRFCMKMRTWASTLPMDQSSLSRRKENGTKRQPSSRHKETISSDSADLASVDSRDKQPPVPAMRHRERGVDTQINNNVKSINGFRGSSSSRKLPQSLSPIVKPGVDLSIVSPSNNTSVFLNHNESITASLNQRLEEATRSPGGAYSNPDHEIFNVTLTKDPHFGLGLTLVDGEIEKMEGIYVRSITPGGPAHLEGRLRVADRVTSINGISLEAKSRHDAVDLVRQSASQVQMGILRLRFVYSSSESIEQSQNLQSDKNNTGNGQADVSTLDIKKRRFEKSPNISDSRKRLDKMPSPSKSPPIPSVDLLNNNDSIDFSVNNQSAQNSMVWLDDTSTGGGVSFYSRTLSALDESSRMYSGLRDDESDDSAAASDNNDDDRTAKDRENGANSNVTDKKPTPATRKYVRASKSSLGVNNNDQRRQVKSKIENELQDRNSNLDLRQQPKNNNKSRSLSNLIVDKEKSPKSNNKDWTEDVTLTKFQSPSDELELICISLSKNESGSLGIQVAGGKGQKKVYVKALVAEPAISCKQIVPGDQLASVNEISTRGMSHHEVVELLRKAESPVHLGLLRQKSIKKHDVKTEPLVETIDVMLEKPASGSLGLSLARPPSSEGIYIRVISAGSVAALDGRLKVGDRLWMINGESVANCSPAEVVEKLKAAQGFVKLVLKREIKDCSINSADLRA